MFGFSLPKLIFTILVVVVVFYGFKAVTRLQERRQASGDTNDAPRGGTQASARGRSAPESDGSEDMIACTDCGTYVAASGARSCGRGDCPYPG